MCNTIADIEEIYTWDFGYNATLARPDANTQRNGE